MTREEIQQAIAQLTADERSRLRAWLERFEESQAGDAAAPETAAEKFGRVAGRTFADFRKRMRETCGGAPCRASAAAEATGGAARYPCPRASTNNGAGDMSATSLPKDGDTRSDHEALAQLNRDYIDAVQNSDVRRFEQILADDFLCSHPDGSLVDRAKFLQQTAQPVTIKNLAAEEVNIRLMGDFAIIHARTRYTKSDGQPGEGRYTDVWARRQGRWLAVSAHVTRL
jgi:ketosteroid isomerase-like protein